MLTDIDFPLRYFDGEALEGAHTSSGWEQEALDHEETPVRRKEQVVNDRRARCKCNRVH